MRGQTVLHAILPHIVPKDTQVITIHAQCIRVIQEVTKGEADQSVARVHGP
jgi:hypothetical protein